MKGVDALDQLREMYVTKLGKGPFPNADCSAARLNDREHGILVLYLADIAGIASHGRKLASISADRHAEFERIAGRSFEEQWPDTSGKITLERSPTLFRLMKDTEEARQLIMRCLAAQSRL